MPEVEFEIVGSIVPKFKDFANGIIAQAQAQSVSMIIDREIEEVADVLATATVALLPFPDGASFRRSSMLAMANCGVPIVTTTGSDTPADLRPFIEQAVDVADLARLTLLYLRDEGSRFDSSPPKPSPREWFWMVGIGRWIFSTIRGSGSTVTRGPQRIHKLTFTLSGPVLLLLIAYVFLRKPRTLAYMVLFFAPFSATAIVNFGGPWLQKWWAGSNAGNALHHTIFRIAAAVRLGV